MGIKGESDLEQRKEKSLFKDSLWNNENKERDGNRPQGYGKVINIFSEFLSKGNKAKI